MSLLVIAVVGILLIAVFSVMFFTIRNIYIENFQKQTVDVNEFVVAQINGDKIEEYSANFNKDGYYWELQRMLYRLKSIFNIKNLYILADTGEAETYTYIFYAIFNERTQSFDDSQYGKTESKSIFPGSERVLRDGLPFREAVFSDNEQGRVFYAYTPIINSGGYVVAFLGIEISAEPMYEDINRVTFFLILFAVISFAVIYVVLMLYSNKYVAKPLVKLSADVTDFSQGYIGIEIPKDLLSRKDELGLIYRSFSNVITTIGNLIDDLRNTADNAIKGNIDAHINYAGNYLGSYKYIVESIGLLMDNTRKIFNLMPVYFFVYDYGFNLLYRNIPAKSFVDAVYKKGVFENEILKSTSEALKASFLEFAKSENDNCMDSLCITLSDNTVRHYNYFLIKNNPRDGVKNICCVLTDVTDYVEASDRALAASKAKTDFLAAMSHEIRTPMNAIIGVSQIQMQKKDLPNEYASALQKIYASGTNLLGIINDILDMSKIESGKFEINNAEYDVPSLINDAVQLNIVRIGSKQIEFLLDVDENLPSRMLGDELRLKQILNNLLSNGIKYTNAGYVKLLVSSRIEAGADIILRFVVEDTGQGMKAEDQEKLFSEYSRFNTETNRATEGTGLGLNITQKLAAMMDGKITVHSEYGKGSTFIVEVKQQAVECASIGVELAERLKTFTFSGDKQSLKLQFTRYPMPYGKVLVVDDLDTNLYVAEGLLAPYQLNIETSDSGFAAIEKIENGKIYDVIFMDHMMPKMDGIQTTLKLREMGYTGVIVALTANALAGNDEMFKQNGFDGFIAKPIDLRELNAALNTFIRDRNPEEAEKYKAEKADNIGAPKVTAKMLEVFRRDTEKAAITLRQTTASGDIKLFTTTAHAMKSALANVGKSEVSQAAAALEEAGLNNNWDFINVNTENFIKTLEEIIKELAPTESVEKDDASILEDTGFLTKQLEIIAAACGDYDDTAAYTALDRLKEKTWKAETSSMLEEIRDTLYLHSDFDGAAEKANLLKQKRENV